MLNGLPESPIERAAAADTNDPAHFEAWTRFHHCVESLNDEDREVFDLLWYQGLTTSEAAQGYGRLGKNCQPSLGRRAHEAWHGAGKPGYFLTRS